jgi:hypothetical protein
VPKVRAPGRDLWLGDHGDVAIPTLPSADSPCTATDAHASTALWGMIQRGTTRHACCVRCSKTQPL